MDILGKARDALGGIEEVIAGLPGIKGYKEKELRREADKRVRALVAQRLEDQRKRLNSVQADLVGSGGLLFLDNVERVERKLQLLIDRIRTASYGYAPLFDAIKVKEAQLAALADFDQGLLAGVDRVKAGVDRIAAAVGQADPELKESIGLLGATVDDLNTSFSHRNEVILQAEPAAQVEETEEAVAAEEDEEEVEA